MFPPPPPTGVSFVTCKDLMRVRFHRYIPITTITLGIGEKFKFLSFIFVVHKCYQYQLAIKVVRTPTLMLSWL